ncbi:MAG: methylenetetrahydrofolate reductase C-terminal domain-containing protein [Bacteroidales bacterium]|nr:methylenetetrahydrofolate reductase C-terminal domain-containing protein [Bacteroidales bacterium]
MSGIKPARRWQPRFYPFHRESFGKRFREKIEIMVKGPVWGCRMCGNCLLQETAFICCMECPKGLRNGPCGGVTPDGHCYVDPTRRCVWHAIYFRARKIGREDTLLEVLPPLDWSRVGTETWADVFSQIGRTGTGKFFRSLFSSDKELKKQVWDSVFRTVRQPVWWNGDSEYHAAAYREPVSELEKNLREGRFVVATEVTPPQSADSGKLKNDIELVRPYVKAINFTDASSAIPKMSALACCKVAVDLNAEPVFQIAARDTTRISLQSDAIGAGQFGIRNILCVTGDSPVVGPPPASDMNINDLDSVQMLWILRRMRDEGIYLDGRKMKHPPSYFLGAATTPFALDPELQAIRDQKKVNAGAQFFQTNIIFEPERLDPWLEQLDRRNVLGKVSILVGLVPLKSYKAALYLHEKVPGVYLPKKILSRMERAGDGAREEGIAITLEMIASIKHKKGISGIHLMSLGWEEVVGRIVREAGLDQA